MKMQFFFSLCLSLCVYCCSTPQSATTTVPAQKATSQAGISGQWIMTVATPRGKQATEITIDQTSATTAMGSDSKGEFAIEIKGEQLRFSRALSTPMGNIDAQFTGTINEYDLAGSMTMSSGPGAGRSIKWSAVRK